DLVFFFQAEDGIRDFHVTGVQTCALPISIYNFSIPAALKAWIDQVTRARRTFRYTEAGPEGLLKGKRAFVVFASGGVPLGSQVRSEERRVGKGCTSSTRVGDS